MAVRQAGAKLVVTSMHPDKYPDSKFSVDPDQVDLPQPARIVDSLLPAGMLLVTGGTALEASRCALYAERGHR